MKLLSDQVTEAEIRVILRELEKVLGTEIPGDVVEFGCYVGTTSVFLAERLRDTGRHLALYDSFAGLPEKQRQDMSPVGEQFKAGELLAPRKVLEKNMAKFPRSLWHARRGWFSDLTADDIPETIAFAFLDGDYYESILSPLQLIWSRLTPGAIVVVDDYGNEALPGAARAVDEWAAQHNLTVKHEQSLAIFRVP